MNKKNILKRTRIIYFAELLFWFILFFVFNRLTPYMSDELYHKPGVWRGISILWNETWETYLNWNGRLIPQFLMGVATAVPKILFDITNSIVYILLVMLIYININQRREWDCWLLAFINLFLWIFGVAFDQTMLWLSGACNYLWGLVIVLGLVTAYKKILERDFEKQIKKKWIFLFLFLWGVAAGWCNENTSGGGLLLMIYYLIKNICFLKHELKNGNIGFKILPIFGMLTGIIAMVSAPGVKVRMDMNLTEESQRGLMGLLGRLLKLNGYVLEDFGILGIVMGILVGYFIVYYGCGLNRWMLINNIEGIIWMCVGIITIYVLLAIPTPMSRALMGAQIFIFIGLCNYLLKIIPEQKSLGVVYYASIITMTGYFFLTIPDVAANLFRIQRELGERQEFVNEQKEQGNLELELPELSREWNNKYTFIYHENDIQTEGTDIYGNEIYRVYYGLNRIEPMTRQEWIEKYTIE